MAKRAPMWGVHYRLPGRFTDGLYKARCAFSVRGRTFAEAMAAARNHKLFRRGEFIVIRHDSSPHRSKP